MREARVVDLIRKLLSPSNDVVLFTSLEMPGMPARGFVVIRVLGGEVLHEGRESRLRWIERSCVHLSAERALDYLPYFFDRQR